MDVVLPISFCYGDVCRLENKVTVLTDVNIIWCWLVNTDAKYLIDGSFKYFQGILKQVWENIPEVKLLTINHDTDHIHMHLSIPPKVRVSDVVRIIKSITGRCLKKKFEYIRKAYWGINGIWSDGYFVSTVGINEHVIKRYIEHQGQEDMGQAQLVLDL